MNFKSWLYTESFELPFSTIKEIYNYYLEGYGKYLKKPRTKIDPKLFFLKLEETNYAFLQYLNPSVIIHLKGSIPGASGIYRGIREGVGHIELSFSDFEHISYSTVEHEVLHYIQDLIQQHASKKNKNKKFPLKGGLPNIPLVKRIMDFKKINVGGMKSDRRTKHEHRPIEFYTNLNSLIRSLQYYYVLLGIELGRDRPLNQKFRDLNVIWDSFADKDPEWLGDYSDPKFIKKLSEWVSNKRNKKFFFNILIERKDYIVSDLDKIKNLDKELYQIYLKKIYKNFINNSNFGFNASEIKKIIDSGKKMQSDKKDAKYKKEIAKKEKINNSIKLNDKLKTSDFYGRLSIRYWDIIDYLDSHLEDSATELAESMFKSIGLTQNEYDDSFSLSLNYKSLFKFFDKIKALRNNFSYEQLPRNVIRCNFDYLAKKMAQSISYRLYDLKQKDKSNLEITVPKQEDILQIFYPGPYCQAASGDSVV